MPRYSHEPVDIDGIPVQLSDAQQAKWDSGDASKKQEVVDKIRGYREEDGPQFDPPTEGHVENVGQRHFQDD